MIDKKFRLFGRVSIVDLLLLAAFIALLFIAVRFSAPQTAAAKPGDVRIRYTAELYKKEEGFINNVNVGDKLYDSLKGYEIGTIVDVYQLPYKEEVPDFATGTIKRPDIDGLYFIYVVAEANAQAADGATSVGQYEIMVGKESFIRTKGFASSAYFVKLEILD